MRKTPPHAIDLPHFLSGWKDIAAYLGRGVRTVQRYEREYGLPVRRPARKSKGSVVATKAELDAWVSASPIHEVFRLTRLPAAEGSAAEKFQNSLDQMGRLRDQMAALRAELRASVGSLRQSVYSLQGRVSRTWSAADFPVPDAEESRSPHRRSSDLAALKVVGRKAS